MLHVQLQYVLTVCDSIDGEEEWYFEGDEPVMPLPLPNDGYCQVLGNKNFLSHQALPLLWASHHPPKLWRQRAFKTKQDHQQSLIELFRMNILGRLTTSRRRIVTMMMTVNPQGQVWIALKVNNSPHELCNTNTPLFGPSYCTLKSWYVSLVFHLQYCRRLWKHILQTTEPPGRGSQLTLNVHTQSCSGRHQYMARSNVQAVGGKTLLFITLWCRLYYNTFHTLFM